MSSSRYGFTGLEGDAEVKGEGNSYTTAYRQYDPRIGRWLSRDALANKFAFYTPYQYAGNRPIVAIDLDGQEDLWIHYIEQEEGSYIKTIEHFEMSETYNRLTKKWLGLELPATGAVTTVKRQDGTYAINSYTPTASVVAKKAAPKGKGFAARLHTQFVHSKGDATGANAGVMEGEEGYQNGGKQLFFAALTLPINILTLGSAAAIEGSFLGVSAGIVGVANNLDDLTTDGKNTFVERNSSIGSELKFGASIISFGSAASGTISNAAKGTTSANFGFDLGNTLIQEGDFIQKAMKVSEPANTEK